MQHTKYSVLITRYLVQIKNYTRTHTRTHTHTDTHTQSNNYAQPTLYTTYYTLHSTYCTSIFNTLHGVPIQYITKNKQHTTHFILKFSKHASILHYTKHTTHNTHYTLHMRQPECIFQDTLCIPVLLNELFPII